MFRKPSHKSHKVGLVFPSSRGQVFLCSLTPHARKALDPSASDPRITTSTPLQYVQSRPMKNAVVAKSGAVSLRSSPNAQEQAASAVSRQHRGEVYFTCKIDKIDEGTKTPRHSNKKICRDDRSPITTKNGANSWEHPSHPPLPDPPFSTLGTGMFTISSLSVRTIRVSAAI